MQLLIRGHQIDLGESFRKNAQEKLEALNEKYQIDPVEATIQVSKQRHQYKLDVSSHLGRGVIVRVHGEADDPYTCLEGAIDNLEKRLRRHKKRIVAFHKNRNGRTQMVSEYVVNPQESENAGEDALAPAIIAEMETEIPHLTVGEAVMRLDLSNEGAVIFRNEKHGELNLVYRRSDGNIGWVDPQMSE